MKVRVGKGYLRMLETDLEAMNEMAMKQRKIRPTNDTTITVLIAYLSILGMIIAIGYQLKSMHATLTAILEKLP